MMTGQETGPTIRSRASRVGQNRDLIHEFLMGHFFPSYMFDLDRRLYVFTSGRYEYRNKGIDVFIEALHALRRRTRPTIVTHDLVDDANAPVLRHLRHRGLFNQAKDRVKVVFHPEFMSATSPLLGMDYDQFERGRHLGVFPLYYEPWGYTPLECVVRGVPAITSDLSGFGTYVMESFPDHDASGMFVARRRGMSFEAAVAQVVEWLHTLTPMSRRERIALRNRVESHAEHLDWNNLIRHYVAAHQLAPRRR